MSRAVNDLDSISGTLQQNLTQLLTSVLTLIGVIVMMLTISWILTLVIVLTLPLSIVIVARIAKRSQKFFMKQQMALGALNGHVAEMYGGHTIVTAFGHEKKSVATFDDAERELLRRRVAGAVRQRHHHADDDVRRQPRATCCVAVIGGVLVTRRSIAIGDVQAFIQYGRQFSMPITQLSGIANMIQLTIVVGRARVRAARRAGRDAGCGQTRRSIAAPRGAVQFDARELPLQGRTCR